MIGTFPPKEKRFVNNAVKTEEIQVRCFLHTTSPARSKLLDRVGVEAQRFPGGSFSFPWESPGHCGIELSNAKIT
jgi:hypothetical protein